MWTSGWITTVHAQNGIHKPVGSHNQNVKGLMHCIYKLRG